MGAIRIQRTKRELLERYELVADFSGHQETVAALHNIHSVVHVVVWDLAVASQHFFAEVQHCLRIDLSKHTCAAAVASIAVQS